MLLQEFRKILSASLGELGRKVELGGTFFGEEKKSRWNSVELGGTLFGDEKKSRWNSVELGGTRWNSVSLGESR